MENEYTEVAQVNDNLNLDQEQAEDRENVAVVDFKMVTFSLAGKDYAIDIMQVKEIAKTGRFTYVPNALPFVLGVYNLRGEIIPIIDLRLFFNIEIPVRKDNSVENMLIVSVGDQLFGVVVDAIDKVVGIQKSTIQPPHPLFGDINIKYIYGVVESQNHLYILLDIERIFNSRIASKEKEAGIDNVYVNTTVSPIMSDAVKAPAKASKEPSGLAAKAEAAKTEAAKPDSSEQDFKFIVEELKNLKKFHVTDINEAWVKTRFDQWIGERKSSGSQLQNEKDADDFLSPFWSPCNGQWWTKQYADEVYKLLPDNSAKQIVVWNPGCGKGYESFSLACLLKKRYPDAKIRIYAQDVDLLNISNAPLVSIPESYANDWYSPYITRKVTGEATFTQEIKDIIMFEYHDCTNSNSLPMVDIVFARDVLSFLPVEAQNVVVGDFDEKLKGNGIIILGASESLGKGSNWGEKTVGSLTYFNKQ
ncbi:MAG: chemotaxis protein CheW [Treponema sp.]|uniref:CheR family methyltransferase n=1 Tax=Treponema sp. TaxID=166 RepID=UPI00298DCCA2|nr:CheR family methyltransferase [Treponema sp.]MCR5386437.1 chemotaxis protein CheW [Treponema sp.]